MSFASHVGRVGALAVALGVGVGVATAPAVAYAQDSDPSSDPASDPSEGTSDSSTSDGGNSRRSGNAPRFAPIPINKPPTSVGCQTGGQLRGTGGGACGGQSEEAEGGPPLISDSDVSPISPPDGGGGTPGGGPPLITVGDVVSPISPPGGGGGTPGGGTPGGGGTAPAQVSAVDSNVTVPTKGPVEVPRQPVGPIGDSGPLTRDIAVVLMSNVGSGFSAVIIILILLTIGVWFFGHRVAVQLSAVERRDV